MLQDELPHRLVVLAEDAHHLFRLRRLREAGEAAKVEEDDGDLAAVGAERIVGAAGHDQLGELGREEPLQPAQALHLGDLVLDALLERPVPLGQLQRVLGLLITEPLLLEAGPDPGSQQHGVAGLRQVVLGAELDRPDHARCLVERRDHQHRDVTALRILLEPLQHRGPVEVGHHDVEQDQVDRLALEEGQRLPAAGRGQDAVALASEPPHQQLTVLLVVVDDQDRGRAVPGRRPRRSRLIRSGDRMALAAVTAPAFVVHVPTRPRSLATAPEMRSASSETAGPRSAASFRAARPPRRDDRSGPDRAPAKRSRSTPAVSTRSRRATPPRRPARRGPRRGPAGAPSPARPRRPRPRAASRCSRARG